MFNPPPEAAGLVTSGGTESILMACLSARQKAYTERRVTQPEMYCSSSISKVFLCHSHTSGSSPKRPTVPSERLVSTSRSEHTMSPALHHPTKSPSHPSPGSSTATPFCSLDPRPTSLTASSTISLPSPDSPCAKRSPSTSTAVSVPFSSLTFPRPGSSPALTTNSSSTFATPA